MTKTPVTVLWVHTEVLLFPKSVVYLISCGKLSPYIVSGAKGLVRCRSFCIHL